MPTTIKAVPETTEVSAIPGGQTGTRDRWVDAGMWLVGFCAAVASWAGWVGLATMCGWDDKWSLGGLVTVYLAWLLPLAVDVYALIGFRVWLRSGTASEATRDFARLSTFMAIGLGVGGNASYHLMVSIEWTDAPWPVVVVVSALPPVMLGAVAHLSALINRDHARRIPAVEKETQVSAPETTQPKPAETPPAASGNSRPPLVPPAPRAVPETTGKTAPAKPVQRRVETVAAAAQKTAPAAAQTAIKPTDEDHLKTIRETHPEWASKTVTLGQIKTAIGITGQATAIRLRDALYPNGRPDQTTDSGDDKETAPGGLALGPFPIPEPRETVPSKPLNGHSHLSKESN